MNFIRFSLKKSKLLSKIATESNFNYKDFDAEAYFNQTLKNLAKGKEPSKHDIYIDELLTLLAKDTQTTNLLKSHGRTFDDIRKIISLLESTGAGQIVKGHYVPVSSIAFLGQLRIILEHWDGENFKIENLDAYNSNLKISHYLIQSFE